MEDRQRVAMFLKQVDEAVRDAHSKVINGRYSRDTLLIVPKTISKLVKSMGEACDEAISLRLNSDKEVNTSDYML